MTNVRTLTRILLTAVAALLTLGAGLGSARADEQPPAHTASATAANIDGYQQIRNLRTSGCIDVKNRSHTAGGDIRQYNCGDDQASQLWRLEQVPGTSYLMFRNRESFQCIDIRGTASVPPNRTVIEQQPCAAGKTTQRWSLRFVGFYGNKTAYNLVSLAGSKCLDLDDGSSGNDKRIQVWDCQGPANDHQLWYLTWARDRWDDALPRLLSERVETPTVGRCAAGPYKGDANSTDVSCSMRWRRARTVEERLGR